MESKEKKGWDGRERRKINLLKGRERRKTNYHVDSKRLKGKMKKE